MSRAHKIKIIVVGDSRVGKTSLRRKYMGDGFKKTYTATIGAEFSVKKVLDNVVTIYDLAGDRGSKNFRSQYYFGAQGILMVYDISSKESFTNLEYWIAEIKENLPSDIVLFILGNKADLYEYTTDPVTEDEGYEFGLSLEDQFKSVSYLSTSALTGFNVEVAFSKIVAEITYD